MESAAINLYTELARVRPTRLVKYGLSNRWLPLVLILLFSRGLWNGWFGRIDAIVLQDGVLGPLGRILQFMTRKPAIVIVHGLEVTHPGRVHRLLMDWSLPHIRQLVAVSRNTRDLITARYPEARVVVVNNGVLDIFGTDRSPSELDGALAEMTGEPIERVSLARIVITVGRLVRRKGVSWFIVEVLPRIVASTEDDVLYCVVGNGPERAAIERVIATSGFASQVRMLGSLDFDALVALYNRADAFVMPNIAVPGDVEGFGIVALEAAVAGVPVIATAIDGIPDAVHAGANGTLVQALDADAFARAVLAADSSELARKRIHEYTVQRFSWASSASAISDAIDVLLAGRHRISA